MSGDQLNVTKFFPETFGDGGNKPFCKDCDFLQWGAWGTRVNFSNADGPQYTDNIHLGWWVAGDVIDQSDLPTDMTASYEGHAIGNVATNIGHDGWVTYVADRRHVYGLGFQCAFRQPQHLPLRPEHHARRPHL